MDTAGGMCGPFSPSGGAGDDHDDTRSTSSVPSSGGSTSGDWSKLTTCAPLDRPITSWRLQGSRFRG